MQICYIKEELKKKTYFSLLLMYLAFQRLHVNLRELGSSMNFCFQDPLIVITMRYLSCFEVDHPPSL